MKNSVFAAIAVLALASCATTGKDAIEQTESSASGVLGQWSIESINVNDTTIIVPKEISPDEPRTISFEADSSFNIQTNCNLMGGQYVVNADSITMSNMFSTRMMCPDMSVEESLSVILPQVNTYSVTNDSTILLNTGNANQYVTLRKLAE